MKRLLITAFALFLTTLTIAQEKSKFGIKFSGFVKTDIIFDSRQTVTAREGHFHLYPMNELIDDFGRDINSKDNFNMLSIQSRLKGTITGPDAFGAKTSAVIEGAFFGHTNPDINGFRLRHAFAKLNWENTELLVGQYWHAMFITDCFPGTVSFNTGAPFQPFSRNPQIRLTQKIDDVKLVFTAMSQRDFSSTGPDGASSQYLRNGVMPEFNFTVQYHKKNKQNEFLFGASADYLSLVPRIQTPLEFSTNENVNSFSFMAFMKIKSKDITMKFEGVMGQNTYHLTMIGGYAQTGFENVFAEEYTYTPMKTLSIWSDIHSNGKKFQVGLFTGYSKNKGLIDNEQVLNDGVFARGANIDYVYRIAPRIIFNSGKMRFAGEIEYTAAAYGTADEELKFEESNEVGNLRVMMGVYYFF